MIPASVWDEMHCDACGKVALGLRWIEEWQTWLCSTCDPLLAWDARWGRLSSVGIVEPDASGVKGS